MNTRTGPAETPIIGPVWWVAALYLIGALFAQVELMHYFSVRGAEPSLVLVVVVWYALRSDVRGALIFGLLAGVCEDALGAQTGAAWTVSTTLAALFSNYLTRWFFADSIPVFAGVVIASTLLRRMIFWVMMALGGYPAGYARLHLHQALWEALLNAILAAAAAIAARHYEDRAVR